MCNTLELVNRIKDVNVPPRATLASFDVMTLFTEVPLPPTIRHVERNLLENNIPIPNEATEEFLSLSRTQRL